MDEVNQQVAERVRSTLRAFAVGVLIAAAATAVAQAQQPFPIGPFSPSFPGTPGAGFPFIPRVFVVGDTGLTSFITKAIAARTEVVRLPTIDTLANRAPEFTRSDVVVFASDWVLRERTAPDPAKFSDYLFTSKVRGTASILVGAAHPLKDFATVPLLRERVTVSPPSRLAKSYTEEEIEREKPTTPAKFEPVGLIVQGARVYPGRAIVPTQQTASQLSIYSKVATQNILSRAIDQAMAWAGVTILSPRSYRGSEGWEPVVYETIIPIDSLAPYGRLFLQASSYQYRPEDQKRSARDYWIVLFDIAVEPGDLLARTESPTIFEQGWRTKEIFIEVRIAQHLGLDSVRLIQYRPHTTPGETRVSARLGAEIERTGGPKVAVEVGWETYIPDKRVLDESSLATAVARWRYIVNVRSDSAKSTLHVQPGFLISVKPGIRPVIPITIAVRFLRPTLRVTTPQGIPLLDATSPAQVRIKAFQMSR